MVYVQSGHLWYAIFTKNQGPRFIFGTFAIEADEMAALNEHHFPPSDDFPGHRQIAGVAAHACSSSELRVLRDENCSGFVDDDVVIVI